MLRYNKWSQQTPPCHIKYFIKEHYYSLDFLLLSLQTETNILQTDVGFCFISFTYLEVFS